MNNEELLSKTITWLRFPLAVAIVFVHVNPFDELRTTISQIDYSHFSGTDMYNIIRFFISDVISRVATPCFCIFSGFLFFNKCKVWNRSVYFQKIKRKSKTLVLPYVLWNIIPVAMWICIFSLKYFIKPDDSLSLYLKELWEKGLFTIFWNYNSNLYPYNIPLWFLRDLIVVAFISPVVYYFIKYLKIYSLIILGFFYFTNFWFPVVSIRALFFFSFGAYFSIHGKNMVVELHKGRFFWIISAIITLILSIYYHRIEMYKYFYILFTVSVCASMIIIASDLIQNGRVSVNNFLSKTSFFIFSVHQFFLLGKCMDLLDFVFSSNHVFVLTIKYFLAPVICVGVCLGLYYVAKKTIPKTLGILTGSR